MRIMVLHRSRLFASCLAEFLDNPPESTAVQTDWNSDDLAQQIADYAPDVVVIDLDLPEHRALALIHQIGGREQPRVLTLLASDKHPDVPACVQEGVSGLLLEESSLEELKTALQTISQGEFYCSPRLARALFRLLASGPGTPPAADWQPPTPLTQRELQVVRLLAEGLSNKQIARRLSVSLYTVKNHVHNILDKLQVRSRHEAADLAHRRRLVERTPAR